ncbi:hypothetical protein [Amycolatopsis sp. NPDC049868]
MIDFSGIDKICRTVEHGNRIDVRPQHPYVGNPRAHRAQRH